MQLFAPKQKIESGINTPTEEQIRDFLFGLLKLKEDAEGFILAEFPEENDLIPEYSNLLKQVKKNYQLIEELRDKKLNKLFDWIHHRHDLKDVLRDIKNINDRFLKEYREIYDLNCHLVHLSKSNIDHNRLYKEKDEILRNGLKNLIYSSIFNQFKLKNDEMRNYSSLITNILNKLFEDLDNSTRENMGMIIISNKIINLFQKSINSITEENKIIEDLLKKSALFINEDSVLFKKINLGLDSINSIRDLLYQEEQELKSEYDIVVRVIPRNHKKFDELIVRWWRRFGKGCTRLQLDCNTNHLKETGNILTIDHHSPSDTLKGLTATQKVFTSIPDINMKKKYVPVADHIDLDMLLSHFVFKNPEFAKKHENTINELANYCDYLIGSKGSKKLAYTIIGMLNYYARRIANEKGKNGEMINYTFLEGRKTKEKLFSIVFTRINDILTNPDKYNWFFNYEMDHLRVEFNTEKSIKKIEFITNEIVSVLSNKCINKDVLYSLIYMKGFNPTFLLVYYKKGNKKKFMISLNPSFFKEILKYDLVRLAQKLNNIEGKNIWAGRSSVIFNKHETSLSEKKLLPIIQDHLKDSR